MCVHKLYLLTLLLILIGLLCVPGHHGVLQELNARAAFARPGKAAPVDAPSSFSDLAEKLNLAVVEHQDHHNH